jgi:hypothetical protein
MGKPLMVAALTWSLMHASDRWLDSCHVIDTALLITQQVSHSLELS